MNKQEALKQIEEQRDMILDLHGWAVFGYIKGIINQLDEPQKIELPKVDFKKSQKVKVLQFVADVIEGAREESPELEDAFKYAWEVATIEFREWFRKLENRNNFARAWLDGYEVEKEKRYLVKEKSIGDHNNYLKYNTNQKNWYFGSRFIYVNDVDTKIHHTRKELEEVGFGWVFDFPGVEIEEVE
ncbi:DUF1642 domain-containing protein [Streptococcus mitis]|uniref:DUF1642 domain-containing protein n=1 Tax=Streptococcus mitis TaxID=28037 RepID=UPI0021B75597|nr:DUF1642 domain-containing protein [Streptococcus mitis]